MGSNTDVVRTLFEEVMNKRRLELLDDVFAPDVVDHQKIVLTEPEGDGAAAAGLRMFLAAFPDVQADVLHVVSEGDNVAVRFALEGTNTGEYRYLPAPTGQHARWEAIGIFRLVDGRITEIWGTADRMGMLTQLGLLPDMG